MQAFSQSTESVKKWTRIWQGELGGFLGFIPKCIF